MASKKEVLLIKKAAMFDLKRILREDSSKTYTVEELEKIIDAYIDGSTEQ